MQRRMCRLVPLHRLVVAILLAGISACPLGGDVEEFVEKGKAQVELRYDANGGSGALESDYAYAKAGGTVQVASGSALSRRLFLFSGWNTAADGKGKAYAAGDTVSLGNADLTLYAQWKPSFVLAAGERSSYLVDETGTLWAWGNNDCAQLGDGTTTSRLVPVRISAISDVVAVTAGYCASLALKADGSAWVWGRNDAYELGIGVTDTAYVAASPVRVLSDVAAIGSGNVHFLAAKKDGTAWGWGQNGNAALGIGTTVDSSTPVQVQGLNGSGFLTDIVAVGASTKHSLAAKSDGTAWAWGYNPYGQVGNGTADLNNIPMYRPTPVQVLGEGGTGYLADIVAVDAGYLQSLALASDGTVWTWGRNNLGQLGNGTTTDSATPVRVVGEGGAGYLSDIVAISAGYNHNMALDAKGTVWIWGANYLGNGTSGGSSSPVAVSGLSSIIAISSGFDHCLAVKKDGTVWAWGSNASGLLGDGTTTDRLSPVKVAF